MRKDAAAFLAGILIALIPIGAAGQDVEVSKVSFDGNWLFPEKKLNSLIQTKSVGWFKRHIMRREPYIYSESVLAADIARVRRFYQTEGYLGVEIAPPVLHFSGSGESVKITIPIKEGKPVRVRSVKRLWDLSGRVPGASTDSTAGRSAAGRGTAYFEGLIEEAAPDLGLAKDKRFRDDALFADWKLMRKQLAENGYPYTVITHELAVSPEEHAADITWKLSPGPWCRFDTITVQGNEKVPAKAILHQVDFKSGDPFDEGLLGRSQRLIYNLGMLSYVTVKAVLSDSLGAAIPVAISVREAPRFTSRVGAGYGNEDGIRLFAEIRKLGLFGGTRQLTLFVKRSDRDPFYASLSFVRPAFFTPRTTLTVMPFVRRQDEPAYVVDRAGGNVSVSHVISRFVTITPSYTYEKVRQVSGNVPSNPTGVDDEDAAYPKSTVAVGLTFDSSLPLFDQTRGTFIGGSVDWGGLGFGEDEHYFKTLVELRRYNRLRGLVLAYRVQVGGIEPYLPDGFVPAEECLYTGGSSSVRGWGNSELGPKLDGEPIGGYSLFLGSVEARYALAGSFGLAAFADAGNVWAPAFTYRFDDLAYSIGAGLRLKTPIGPVRFDVAWPLTDARDTDESTQYILSIGQAF
jgi:outer membrane protein assembly complex protein YaeT